MLPAQTLLSGIDLQGNSAGIFWALPRAKSQLDTASRVRDLSPIPDFESEIRCLASGLESLIIGIVKHNPGMNERLPAHFLRAFLLSGLVAFETALPQLSECQPGLSTAPGQNPVIGMLDYEIVQTSPYTSLRSGRMTVRLMDVQIKSSIASDGSQVFHKLIPLGPSLSLEQPEFSTTRKAERGFGLSVERTDMKTVCWEWFSVDGPTHAKKLQETGELGFRVAKVGGIWQKVRTDFLTDISMRLWRDAGTPDGFPKEKVPPVWRVKIRKGSYIKWPCLVNGRIVLN